MKKLTYLILLLLLPVIALAEDGSDKGIAGLAPGIAFGLAAIGGALGQGKAISAFMEAVGRNPGAAGSLSTSLLIGLVFIETLVIFGLVVVFAL
jgi:F-type H+-transporting ATPase subunit c